MPNNSTDQPKALQETDDSEAKIFAIVSAALNEKKPDAVRTIWAERIANENSEAISIRVSGALMRTAIAMEDLAWFEAICEKCQKYGLYIHPLSAQRAFDLAKIQGNIKVTELVEPYLPTRKGQKPRLKSSATGRGKPIPHDGKRPRIPTRWSKN